MSLLEIIKQPNFWSNFTKVALPFFVIVTVLSLLFNHYSEISSGDFETVYQTKFSEGKWKAFFGFKIVFSVFYGLYITFKKMK